MKKLFIVLIFIVFIIIDFLFLNSKLEIINSLIDEISGYSLKKNGIAQVDAEYKGAHGESYPASFLYNYEINNNSIRFSNEDGYKDILLDGIYKKIVLKPKMFLFNKIYLDVEEINKSFNTSYKKVFIKVGLNKMTLKLDEDYIDIYKDKYSGIINGQKINLVKSSFGYTCFYGDNIKINIEINRDNTIYSIVKDAHVYSLEETNDEFIFNASTSESIYNSLKITFKNGKIKSKYNKEIEDNDMPIVRYFKSVE